MNSDFDKAKSWRQGLKAGDGVVITEKGIGRRKRITTVERVTATQIIVSDRGRRFNKQYGRGADKNRSDFTSLTHRTERLTDEEIAVMLDAVFALRASQKQVEP